MSKCHYIYDKQAGKVLIPCCWAVVLSNDIRDCTCRNEDLTFAQFERERYNKELEKRNSIIKELQSENKYLHKELKRHVTLLTYIIHSGFISGYQNRYGDNLKPPTNVYHRMTA